MNKVKIVSGEHKGKIGEVTSMLWVSQTCVVKFDNGEELPFKFYEIENIKEGKVV